MTQADVNDTHHGFASADDVISELRARGGRATSSRRALLEVLFRAHEHLTADQLASEMQARYPDVHISTVYRNLEDLEALGVIVHTHLGHGPATYQLASLAHAHFICGSCGVTIEASDEMFREFSLSIRETFGFVIDPSHFAIFGQCAACTSPPH